MKSIQQYNHSMGKPSTSSYIRMSMSVHFLWKYSVDMQSTRSYPLNHHMCNTCLDLYQPHLLTHHALNNRWCYHQIPFASTSSEFLSFWSSLRPSLLLLASSELFLLLKYFLLFTLLDSISFPLLFSPFFLFSISQFELLWTPTPL